VNANAQLVSVWITTANAMSRVRKQSIEIHLVDALWDGIALGTLTAAGYAKVKWT
jgi:hypothetical protein